MRRRLPSLGRRLAHSRRGTARHGTASASEAELEEHAARMAEVGDDIFPELPKDIERLKLGRRKRSYNIKAASDRRQHATASSLLAAVRDLKEPFPERLTLPEVAFVGRSNCGKSSLLNALTGIKPSFGTAATSARAGWTKSIQFYEINFADRPPFMTFVDFPGYGPTPLAATDRTLRKASIDRTKVQWGRLVRRCAGRALALRPTAAHAPSRARRYLKTREQLRCVFVLVESTLGLTPSDREFLETLRRLETPFEMVMTKADLLPPMQLAQSATLVRRELDDYPNWEGSDVPMVAAKNGTGVTELWARMAAGIDPRALVFGGGEDNPLRG